MGYAGARSMPADSWAAYGVTGMWAAPGVCGMYGRRLIDHRGLGPEGAVTVYLSFVMEVTTQISVFVPLNGLTRL